MATKLYAVALGIRGYWVWNILHFTLLVRRILSWILDFRKICTPLFYTVTLHENCAYNIYTYSGDRKRLRLGVESVCKWNIY
jgi:hypothetical protein